MGRKTILTDEIQDKIVETLRAGVQYEVAAQRAGVSERVIWDWINKGQVIADSLENSDTFVPSETELKYLRFLRAITEARAEVETIAAGTLLKAGTVGLEYKVKEWVPPKYDDKGNETAKGYYVERVTKLSPDPKHLTFLLERGFHRRWGRRQAIELTGEEGGPIKVEQKSIAVQLNAQLDQIRERELAAAADLEETATIIALPVVEGNGE
jgi:hypothetical protein